MVNLHEKFKKQNAAAEYVGIKVTTVPNPSSKVQVPAHDTVLKPILPISTACSTTPKIKAIVKSNILTSSNIPDTAIALESNTVSSTNSPAFLEKLSCSLNVFWTSQLQQMRLLGTTVPQTEQNFKNHNDLPLARIKRIMKSDEDVRMISAEAPVLFAKACEMFILELTLRSWAYSENNKRRTLQKEDMREAIQKTDIFDFLVDVIH